LENKQILEASIDNYLAQLATQAAEEARSPRLRTPAPATDIDGFFRLVGQALKRQQEIDGAKKEIFYTEEFPEKDDNINGEVITYSVVSRLPGTFERKNVGAAMNEGNIRQRRKIFREATIDPDHPGSRIYTYGQWFDNRVEFDIIAQTNKTANQRAIWFEDFMDSWTWFFEANGIASLRYEGRGADSVVTPENKKIAIRPMIYYVHTEKVTVVREHTLRSLIVASSLS
jgi:hypothetical protein